MAGLRNKKNAYGQVNRDSVAATTAVFAQAVATQPDERWRQYGIET